jgi:chromosomal replication initiation ATPase DnaA
MRKLWSRKQASIASLSARYNLPQSAVKQIVFGIECVKPKIVEAVAQRGPIIRQSKYSRMTPRPLIVLGTVAEFFKHAARDLKSDARRKDATFARQVAMLMLYEFTPLSKAGVGKILRRDRATVLHGLRKISGMISEGKIPEIHELRQRIANNLDKDQHVKMAA